MELQGGEVGSAVRTAGGCEETKGLKLPSMSGPPVSTEQPLEPELLERIEEPEDADPGLIGADGKHKRDRDDD